MLAIIQARMMSSRLPGKVLKVINGQPILLWQIERVNSCKDISSVVVATTTNREDDELVEVLESRDIEVFRGDSEDVLSRFIRIAKEKNAPNLVRLTGDCPLFMPQICSEMISLYSKASFDYFSNTLNPSFPDGCDIEILKSECLSTLTAGTVSKVEIEHVTFGLYTNRGKFKCGSFEQNSNDSNLRWTLDTEEDLTFIEDVYRIFKGKEILFDYNDLMDAIKRGLVRPIIDTGSLRNNSLIRQLND